MLAQTGSKNEQFVDNSQRKSKKTEKSNRPPMYENVSFSGIIKRGARRSLLRSKDQQIFKE